MRRILLFIISCIVLSPMVLCSDDAQSVIQHVQKKYHDIHDATIVFTEVLQFAVMKTEQEFHGTLYLRKPQEYRLEMEEQTIVTDGASVWTFNKANNQLIIDKFHADSTAITPARLLSELPLSSNPTLLGKEKINNSEYQVVKLIPKPKSFSRIRSFKIWVDEDSWLMKKIQTVDANENLSTYSIESFRFDSDLSDSLFIFHPPANAEVIDLR